LLDYEDRQPTSSTSNIRLFGLRLRNDRLQEEYDRRMGLNDIKKLGITNFAIEIATILRETGDGDSKQNRLTSLCVRGSTNLLAAILSI